jgi:CelD/BcsL family acetyltransferase involved in cellulose biosynthesis
MADVLEMHSACEPIESEWDRLAAQLRAPPFLYPGWTCAWWRAFGKGDLCVLAVRRQGRLAGVLPLRRRGSLVASPTNWHTPLFGALVEDQEAARELSAGLLELHPRRVDLSFLDPTALGYDELTAGFRGYRDATRTVIRSPYIEVDGDWEGFLAGRSRNLRQGLRRKRRRLEERGDVSVEVAESGNDLPAALERGFDLEVSGWKGGKGTAIRSSPETERFYREVASWASERGFLRLAFLRLGNRPLAFNYCLEAEGRHYLIKPGYDEEFRELGPGSILTSEMIARTFRLGLKSYEFLGGEDDYKVRWATGLRDRLRTQLFATSVTGALDRVVQTRGRAIARRALALAGR